ncbi:MAG: hypothetical protein II676_02120 [Bacteroidales bacterium]|nr:hypothetical protein [Bacteroidales bacterium]MBQ2544440.1 hypothetical protein [Bacteroidales bacterium]MBQ3941626.1 hypothetical protein [Bacteroidales bacterium]MBQ4201423.1 hypothetical protein [Bacteroidales bacterium]
MKKIMLLMMAALAITMVSCKKAGPDEGEDETKIPVPTYRVKALMKSWEGDDKQSGDMYTYTWNADGTIASVDMAWAKEVYSTMKFNWSGNTVTVVDAKKDNQPVCTITVDDNKHAVKITQTADSEVGKGWKTLECAYDANGFLTLAKADGKVKTVQSIDEEGNIEWWGRVGIEDQVNESPTAAGWRKKMHTYYSNVNAAGIHGEWDEDVAVKRWFYETNLVGRASAHIMRTAWWYGVVDTDNNVVKQEYAAKLAYYPLDVDANNCVVVETKLYDTKEKYESDPSTMGPDDKTAFVCEKIQ